MGSNKTKSLRPSHIDFERYKDTYQQKVQESIKFTGQDLDFFTEVKVRNLLNLTRRHRGDPKSLTILDVGCGVGITDFHLTGHFKKLHGIDLGRGMIRKASTLNPKASYRSYKGGKLPYPTGSMDITFAICVMHHVPQNQMASFAREMVRVTRKGGVIAVFEHNPWNPLTLRAVSNCDLDQDAILLRRTQVARLLEEAGASIVEKKYILFTPVRGALFALLDRWLGFMPLGAQYFVAARK
jgi:SAM-dependent methyltransferase